MIRRLDAVLIVGGYAIAVFGIIVGVPAWIVLLDIVATTLLLAYVAATATGGTE
jgi:hypothetical protein